MTEISARLVKQLRDETGAGMMDCKRALQQTGGDLEAAKRLLREQGMAQAGKRAGRETTEGLVGHRVDADHGTMVAVGCETEPVSKNDEFQAFAQKVLELVDAEGVGAEQKLEDERVELVAKLGENIALAGAARFVTVDGSTVSAYVHPPANKVGALLAERLRHRLRLLVDPRLVEQRAGPLGEEALVHHPVDDLLARLLRLRLHLLGAHEDVALRGDRLLRHVLARDPTGGEPGDVHRDPPR